MFKYKKSRLSAFFAAINIVLADIGGKKTDGRVVINNNGPDLINSAGILAIHFL